MNLNWVSTENDVFFFDSKKSSSGFKASLPHLFV